MLFRSNQFLTEALQGTISDAYQNAQIAAQQQGFQNAQQQQAFQQAMAQRQLEDQLTNSAFARASQQLASGSTGSPAEMGLTLANLFGNQAGQAGSSAAGIAAAIQAQQNADRQYQLMSQYFRKLGINPDGTTGQYGSTPVPYGGSSAIPDWLQGLMGTTATAPTTGQQVVQNPDTGQLEYVDPFASIDPATGLPWGESLPFGGGY